MASRRDGGVTSYAPIELESNSVIGRRGMPKEKSLFIKR
jgi:hypothetical protein